MNWNKIIKNTIKPPTNFEGAWNRSSERTDMLHQSIETGIASYIDGFYDKFKVKHEYSIACGYGNKMKIDIAIFDKITGELHTCILVKALVRSLQKNRPNIANTSVGEAFGRIRPTHPNVNIQFITTIGRTSPNFKNTGVLVGMDKIETSYVNLALNENLPAYKNIYFSTIKFDGIADYSTDNNMVSTIKIENIDATKFNNDIKKIYE